MGFLGVMIALLYSSMLSFTFLPFAHSVYFKFSSFGSDTKDILYRGSAVPSSGSIQFNDPEYSCLVGQAIYSEKVPIWDSNSRKITDFTTHFSFTIDTLDLPSSSYGDGFAFFLAPVDFQIAPNSAGSYLGLFNISNYRVSSQNQIIVIEFDSYADSWDPPYEHVGINKNSLTSSNYTTWNAGSHSGDTAEVVVSYNATTMMLIASWTYDHPTTAETSSLQYQVDLREVLPEWVTIGFSASTGRNTEKNTLHYWEFDSSLNRKWPSTGTRKSSQFWKGFRVDVGIFVGTAIVTTIVLSKIWKPMWWRRLMSWRRPTEESKEAVPENASLIANMNNDNTESEVGLPMRYSYNDIKLATSGFSDKNKLGRGGFGEVYKGYLPNLVNKEVAVKKIFEHLTQGTNEYVKELATIIRLKHRNLVQLVGWCQDQTRFLLVYEIMAKGSLDAYLFGKKDPLDWDTRYKIVTGLASAMLYLHEDCGDQYVVHRDIKPSNVMLDHEFNAKLGDFGLARFIDHNRSGLETSKVAGTLGYLAPEYINTCKASKESDMYSFGVVALNIGSGKTVKWKDVEEEEEDQASGDSMRRLVETIRQLHESGQLLSAVDKRLPDFDKEQYKRLMTIGLSCTQDDPSKRPTIGQAIQALKTEVKLPEDTMNMPPNYHDPTAASSSGTK